MCWRHSLRLFFAAYGSLLDITGRSYLRFSRRVLDDAVDCEACHDRVAKREAALK